jgi:hypothetical protein
MASKTVGVVALCLGLLSIPAAVAAHHSRAMFNTDELISVEGVVREVQWRNPHMWITVDVPGPNGTTETWGFEAANTSSMVASGISPQILKAGNRVKFIAHPSRDRSKRTAEFIGMEVNGKFYSRGTGTNLRTAEPK